MYCKAVKNVELRILTNLKANRTVITVFKKCCHKKLIMMLELQFTYIISNTPQ